MGKPDPAYLAVRCPICLAQPKRACISTVTRQFKRWPHPARRKAAVDQGVT